jgi:hypothetical protein
MALFQTLAFYKPSGNKVTDQGWGKEDAASSFCISWAFYFSCSMKISTTEVSVIMSPQGETNGAFFAG